MFTLLVCCLLSVLFFELELLFFFDFFLSLPACCASPSCLRRVDEPPALSSALVAAPSLGIECGSSLGLAALSVFSLLCCSVDDASLNALLSPAAAAVAVSALVLAASVFDAAGGLRGTCTARFASPASSAADAVSRSGIGTAALTPAADSSLDHIARALRAISSSSRAARSFSSRAASFAFVARALCAISISSRAARSFSSRAAAAASFAFAASRVAS